MVLWTMQPLEVWEQLQRDGLFQCDPKKSFLVDKEKYEWLVQKMKERIGPPPKGVIYPIWAWYKQDNKRCKPDLRRERWSCGPGGEDYVCIELDVPDEEVLLSDFDSWSLILLNALISGSEDERNALERIYETLEGKKKESFRDRNWERVFNIDHVHNYWTIRGEWVQATFWEIKKEYVRDVRYFRTGRLKEEYRND